jgi:hypothetical protein
MDVKLNELALLERARAIQRIFSKKVLNVYLIENHGSYTDLKDIYISLDIVKSLAKTNPVQALRVFRYDVAHENAHNYITIVDAESWNEWAGTDLVKRLIYGIIEDRRVDFAVSRRYKAYAIAKRTLDSYLLAQVNSPLLTYEADLINLFRNSLILACLIGKVPARTWDFLSKEAQKAILLCKDILDGKENSREGNKTKFLPVDLIYDYNVLASRANRIYDIVLPFFQNPGNIKGEGEGEKGEEEKEEEKKGKSEGITHVGDKKVDRALDDLNSIPREDYEDVVLPSKSNQDIFYFNPSGYKGVMVNLDLNSEDFEELLRELNADKEPTSSEVKEVQAIFGIDLSKEMLEKMSKARQDILTKLFGKHVVDIPQSNFERYQRFRDSEVNQLIAKLSRAILEDTRLKRKTRVIESGGLLSSTFLSQYLARDREIFTERVKSKRSVSWAILIDVSGSVTEKEVIRTFIALSEVGKAICGEDKLLLATFDDKYHLVKDFSEGVDQVVRGRIGNSYFGGSTNICCSIEKTAYRLSKTLAEKKVLIVVSDGEQNTCELNKAEHLQLAVANAKKLGIIPIHIQIRGISIPGMHRIEINELTELADRFIQLYQKIAWARKR